MIRSWSPHFFREATKDYPELVPPNFDVEGWLANPKNIMWWDDGDIGLATFEYPGVYNCHWFFRRSGKAALTLGKEMLKDLFDNHGGRVAVGMTRTNLKAARWASRQLGFKSQGLMDHPNGECEMFCLTREDFIRGNS